MKLLSMLLVVCLCAAAQEPKTATKPKQAAPTIVKDIDLTKMLAAKTAPPSSSPERVVAVVDGMKITAGELFRFYETMPSNMQFYYGQNRKEFVERYAVVGKLAGVALTRKLDQQEPYKHQLDSARQNILMQAAMDDFNSKSVIKEEDQQKYYKQHPDDFTQVKVSGIFIGAFSDNAQKAADLLKKLRSGGDFGKLAKEHSTDRTSADRDGLIGYLDKNGNYPPETMKAILALKPGEISEPVAIDNGFWIFRLEETRVKPYAAVQEQLLQILKQKALLEWVEQTRKALIVDVKDDSYFKVQLPTSLGLEAQPAVQ